MKFANPLLLGLFLIFTTATVLSSEVRTWTDLRGRTLEGSLVKIDGEEVVILLQNGNEVRLKREGLSLADGQYLEEESLEGSRAGEERVYGGITLIWCPPTRPGGFVMGSPVTEVDRRENEKEHRVTLTKGFWLGKTETTQGQWTRVMGASPPKGPPSRKVRVLGADHPMYSVSWEDAVAYCEKLNQVHPLGGDWKWTLPTEAQWEYACRAGTTGLYTGGLNPGLDAMAWWGGNSDDITHPVGEKTPNRWGLFDMHGNVTEWCLDWQIADYYADGQRDPSGPSDPVEPIDGFGSPRVLRGGSWLHAASSCRAAYRDSGYPALRFDYQGFRVAVSSIQ